MSISFNIYIYIYIYRHLYTHIDRFYNGHLVGPAYTSTRSILRDFPKDTRRLYPRSRLAPPRPCRRDSLAGHSQEPWTSVKWRKHEKTTKSTKEKWHFDTFWTGITKLPLNSHLTWCNIIQHPMNVMSMFLCYFTILHRDRATRAAAVHGSAFQRDGSVACPCPRCLRCTGLEDRSKRPEICGISQGFSRGFSWWNMMKYGCFLWDILWMVQKSCTSW